MKNNIIIASDSTTDLGPELIEKYKIKIMPIKIMLGGEEYNDGVDISPDYIYHHYENHNELPKTAASNISEFEEFFAANTIKGNSLIFFTISSEMSSNYMNACIASEQFDNVYVIDSRNLSTGAGLLVLKACDMAAEGYAPDEIVRACSKLTEYVDTSFVIDNLEFLHKGGRCSSIAALGANLLKLKPSIIVRNGRMTVGKKYRGTFSVSLERYIGDQLSDVSEIDSNRVFVTHAGCDKRVVDACVKQVKKLGLFKEIIVTRAGCAVSSHCGRNTLGIIFIRNIKV